MPYRNVNNWILDTGYSIVVNGSLVNLVNLVKWLSYNLDPRLRHSGTSLAGLFGVYLLIRKRAVLRYMIYYIIFRWVLYHKTG